MISHTNSFKPLKPIKSIDLPKIKDMGDIPKRQSLKEWAMAGGGVPDQYKGREHVWHAKVNKFAEGGEVRMAGGGSASSMRFYEPKGGVNAKVVDVPGVGPVQMFFDEANKRIVVSDEGYWNPNSPVGADLEKAVQWAHDSGYQAGVAITPYSSKNILDTTGTKSAMSGATDQELRSYIDAADFVVSDPYLADVNSTMPKNRQALIDFAQGVGDYAKNKGKDTWLYMQGFVPPGIDPTDLESFNKELIDKTKGQYNTVSFFNADEFGPPETSGIKQLETSQLIDYINQSSNPTTPNPVTTYMPRSDSNLSYDPNQDAYHLAQNANVDLPFNWNGLDAQSKLNWFQQNNVNADTLAAAGVRQDDIDWYTSHGLTGSSTTPFTFSSYTPNSVATESFLPNSFLTSFQSPQTQPITPFTSNPFTSNPFTTESFLPGTFNPPGGLPTSTPSQPVTQVNTFDSTPPTQSAGYLRSTGEGGAGLNSYYDEINAYLANHGQDEVQQAMGSYGVSQADIDAAKAYQPVPATVAPTTFTPGGGEDPNAYNAMAAAVASSGFARGGKVHMAKGGLSQMFKK